MKGGGLYLGSCGSWKAYFKRDFQLVIFSCDPLTKRKIVFKIMPFKKLFKIIFILGKFTSCFNSPTLEEADLEADQLKCCITSTGIRLLWCLGQNPILGGLHCTPVCFQMVCLVLPLPLLPRIYRWPDGFPLGQCLTCPQCHCYYERLSMQSCETKK